jgi:2-methylcitrate dehydratase PrpD
MADSSSAGPGPTAALAAFAAETSYEQLGPAVVRQVKRCLLDYLGLVIGASDEAAVHQAQAALGQCGGAPQAAVFSTGLRTSAPRAALLNGIAADCLDFDDIHFPTFLHPTGPAMSAALAVGEWQQATGRELVTAFAVGFEVGCRVALAIHPERYAAGWHITGTAGTFGGAAAAGRLLGLGSQPMRWALGLAGSQASGLRAQLGTPAKALQVGNAAANGVRGALLARHGFEATERIFEGRHGFGTVLSDCQHLERLVDRLGQSWEFDHSGFKPYACAAVTHALIDGLHRLRASHRPRLEAVERIEARLHPLVLELTDRPEPATGLEARGSLQHCAAMALLDGTCGPGQFSDQAVRRPEAAALRRKLTAAVDPSLREDQAEVTLVLRDGRRLVAWVEAASGSPRNPLSDQQLNEKFHELVWPYLPRWKEQRLLSLVEQLEDLETVGAFADLLEPHESGS